jgi:translin
VPDTSNLDAIIPRILDGLAEKNAAREAALSASRQIIRLSANTIRAVHRAEFEQAQGLLDEARQRHEEISERLASHRDLYFTGFVQDAQKEFVEASVTLALLTGRPMPAPEDLLAQPAAYLNGISEVIGELRRWVLDRLRRGDYADCEAVLAAMDDIYSVLVTIDYPDAMTGGLRRSTDQARGILERTRGDLTMAIVQRRAVEALDGDYDG